ncbi:MAG: anthranilate phosphoribosyltransferase, partial [Bacteroidetes bacterium]|nr:anthranilate phosphoribosyltransferase [Bacteroidota bacterium]
MENNILNKLLQNETISENEAKIVLLKVSKGEYNESQIASLITVFLMRNITIEELLGFRDALLETRKKVNLEEFNPIDIVGTGGDNKNTFNISTCSSFVVAGAGYNVVKHGNYGTTSTSGASNVIENHGIKFTSDNNKLRQSIEKCGIAYLHAPLFNDALKIVAPTRKAIGIRSFFNILGPLVNPATPKYQLLGVYNLPLLRLYSYAYQQSNQKYAVVHSLDGYDEISLTSQFKIAMTNYEAIYSPAELGFEIAKESDLFGGTTQKEATKIFDNVLEDKATIYQKNCVIANSAFAIKLIEENKSIEECINIARESIE